MNTRPFIPRDNPDLPMTYGMTIFYFDGKQEEYEIAEHTFMQNVSAFNADGSVKSKEWVGILEIVTVDDLWSCIPLANVKRVAFNKDFSKIVAVRRQQKIKQQGVVN